MTMWILGGLMHLLGDELQKLNPCARRRTNKHQRHSKGWGSTWRPWRLPIPDFQNIPNRPWIYRKHQRVIFLLCWSMLIISTSHRLQHNRIYFACECLVLGCVGNFQHGLTLLSRAQDWVAAPLTRGCFCTAQRSGQSRPTAVLPFSQRMVSHCQHFILGGHDMTLCTH